jgi:hypothetical protein
LNIYSKTLTTKTLAEKHESHSKWKILILILFGFSRFLRLDFVVVVPVAFYFVYVILVLVKKLRIKKTTYGGYFNNRMVMELHFNFLIALKYYH